MKPFSNIFRLLSINYRQKKNLKITVIINLQFCPGTVRPLEGATFKTVPARKNRAFVIRSCFVTAIY